MENTASSSSGVPAEESTSSSDEDELEDPKQHTDTGTSALSLLDVLRAPKPSALSRKRKVLVNRGRGSDKRRRSSTSSSSTCSDPKKVTPLQRVKEFPSEQLVVCRGTLFCNACREELHVKSSTIKNHIRSTKHGDAKEKLSRKEAREQDIATALKAHNSTTHLVGENLPESQQVYRVRVVTVFLKSAVSLSKMCHFRDLLEEGGYRLGDRHTLSDLVPFIQKQEKQLIFSELEGQNVSIVFDGTCRLGEALCLVVRYITNDWSIQQRLIALKMLQRSLTGEEIAREVISTLSIEYHIAPTALIACMRDRAATNNVAVRTLKVLYPKCVDIGCFSHTLDHVGEKFQTPVLEEFISAWISLFAHSPKNKALWHEQTGKSI